MRRPGVVIRTIVPRPPAACRACGASAEVGEAGRERSPADVCAGPTRRRYRRSRWDRTPGADCALEGTATRATSASALGYVLEPAADRGAPAARLSGR
jgi:hypothetical protein